MSIFRLKDIQETVAPDLAVVREVASPSFNQTARHSVAHITVPAGVRIERHYHKQAEEVYHLIKGRGVLEIDGREEPVGPGDTVLIQPGAWHCIEAASDQDLVIIVTCAPAWTPDDQFFK